MTDIYKVTAGAFAANTYVITCSNGDCIAVDCCDHEKVSKFLREKNLNCRLLLLTHAHFDHCGEAALLQRDGAKVYIHEDDFPLVNSDGNLAAAMGQKFVPFVPDVKVKDGEELELFGHVIRVIHTPGHTPGGACYLFDDEVIFSGDTLFRLSVGRTDFPCGDFAALRTSVREKLFTLPKDYKVYPGHGMPTSIAFERDNNRYV